MKRRASTSTRLRDLRDRIARASLASPVMFPAAVAIEAAPASSWTITGALLTAHDVADTLLGIDPDDVAIDVVRELDRETVTITSRTPAAYARLKGGLRAALDARADDVLTGTRRFTMRHG